jgi:SAM-dependent methyltransferase
MNKDIKLNLGASPIWQNESWHILDHKLKKNSKLKIAGKAEKIKLKSKICSVIFCSHVFEHIPHFNLPMVLAEMNRVLKKGGILRILTPDLEKICLAYSKKDKKWFQKARQEDENIRTDLGFGGMLMNFIVSPGQDTVLIDRNLNKFIAGYAHLYSYDYVMLAKLLKVSGFKTRKAKFNDSVIQEMREPLHVKGLRPVWKNLNKKFYKENKLVHKLVKGKYKINFKLRGFDRDPITSLIIEAKKIKDVNGKKVEKFFNESNQNYNIYSKSLLSENNFKNKLLKKKIIF